MAQPVLFLGVTAAIFGADLVDAWWLKGLVAIVVVIVVALVLVTLVRLAIRMGARALHFSLDAIKVAESALASGGLSLLKDDLGRERTPPVYVEEPRTVRGILASGGLSLLIDVPASHETPSRTLAH